MENFTIVTAVIKNKDKYLIAKRAPTKKFSPNQWEFISGFMDVPEESPEKTILREIEEELSVKGNIIEKSNSFNLVDDEGCWTVIPFLVELETQDIRINAGDHSEIKWVYVNELNNFTDIQPFLNNQEIQKIFYSK